MPYKKLILPFLFLIVGSCLASCQPRTVAKNVTGSSEKNSPVFPYELKADRSFQMPEVLREISGITFLPDHANVLYAIQDEDGILFSYDISTMKLLDGFEFAKPGDYEDLATDGRFFYVLKSNGDVYSFPVAHKQDITAVKVFKGLLPKGEYESLAFNASDGKLYALCKDCQIDKKSNGLSGYTISADPEGHLHREGKFSLDLTVLQALEPKIKKRIKPSAMTKNRSRDEWYIISSIDKVLIVTDKAFVPKKIVPFSRKDFEQPEGIAFDKEDNLFISSEAGNLPAGMIFQFKRQKK